MARPGMMGLSDRWVLARHTALVDRLPGTLLIPDDYQPLNIARAVFLVPDAPVDISRVILVLETLAIPRSTPIVFVDLRGTRENNMDRLFNALVACVKEIFPAARGERLYHADLFEAMQALMQSNDLLIVAREQNYHQHFSGLSGETLMRHFNLPVLEIIDIFPPWPIRFLSWIRHALYNVFPLLIVGGFFWLQAQISRDSQGWVGIFTLSTTIVIELAIIFAWSLFLD